MPDKKLASQKFRKGCEEESRKLPIGEQLSRLRQEAGLTQAQVAKRTGTTASAISRYENAGYVATSFARRSESSRPAADDSRLG